jgi:hypothetical protein
MRSLTLLALSVAWTIKEVIPTKESVQTIKL